MSDTSYATDDELALGLVNGFSAFSRQMRLVELPNGMTRERLAIMVLIDEHGPISVSDLANRAHVRAPTMSRMTSALVEDGLARKVSQKTDGRGVLIMLTAKGRRTAKAATRKSVDYLRRALDGLSASQISALSELARRLEAMDSVKR